MKNAYTMYKVIIGLLVIKTIMSYAQPNPPHMKKNFIYGQYSYNTIVTVLVNNETEQILDFEEDTEVWQGYPTRVHVSTNKSVPLDHPVFITATQQKGISSWELPVVAQAGDSTVLYNDMSRTLCPHDAGPDIKTEYRPTIHITTQNPKNTSVDIKLRRVTDFYVEVNKEIPLSITPSTPKYYYFSFDQNPWNVSGTQLQGLPIFNYTIPKSIILIINSEDELCATVSIQNNSCPVFDSEKEIMYQGYHLTMTSKGGITLTQSMFPNGFYVVFVVKENDACTGASETADPTSLSDVSNPVRMKSFRFTIKPTISYKEYAVGALVIVILVTLIAAFVLLAAVPFRNMRHHELITNSEPVPSTSRDTDVVEEEAVASDTEPIVQNAPAVAEEPWSAPHVLTVAKLTQAPPDTLARRSDRYFWGALTVAVVYALPVVQLLFTYQQMVFQTGNQDLCYYNFLCAHPLWFLSDFNHVYSNIAYVMFGAIFMLQVRARQCQSDRTRQELGIPQHYGLLYSMGLGLCMEGFLSACYHLCPNKMNFQFDSSFMYVIAVLVMLKLYQNRHSDLIPSAHSTFMLLALIMSIGLFGILFPSVYFSVFFTVLHLLTCFILTLKIYYAGRFKMEWAAGARAWREVRGAGRRALAPAHTARAVLLGLANIANWTFAIYTAVSHNKDFARQLLAILMGNAILYTWFYIAMKLIHKERLLAHTWVYFVGAHLAWIAAAEQFIDGNTRWSETPAMSRRHNGECSSLQLFDSHDVWHCASAAAMFLSFNLLLSADDDRVSTPHTLIATF